MAEDKESFDALYRRYAAVALSYARLLLGDTASAEDCVQDVFLAVWRNRHLAGKMESFEAYLLKSIHNRALNYLTRNLRGGVSLENAVSQMQLMRYFYNSPESAVVKRIYSSDMGKALDKAISSLPERERQIFRMSYIENIPDKEIGLKLNLSRRTVENCIYRALRKLRESIDLNMQIAELSGE